MSTALPEKFVQRVANDPFLGTELLDALQTESPTAVRLHPLKTRAELPFLRSIPWSENGFFLSERPKFTLDPLFHAGCYYPQEAGSQLLEAVLNQLDLPENPVVLDLCAAPGGKSTLISSFLGNKGLLVSNEVIGARSKVLKENCIKWGYTNSIVTNNDPQDFQHLSSAFDCIVIDAPCSGEGMFRKDHEARKEWSEANVELCSARQKRIVMDVWDALKPGGFIVYSTCTFNTNENEENVKWFLEETGAALIRPGIPAAKEGREKVGHYALPSQLDTEGFYIAVLQKPADSKENRSRQAKNTALQFVKEALAPSELVNKAGVQLVQWSDYLFAVPEDFAALSAEIHKQLRVIKLGTEIGQPTRKELIPNEALALNPFLRSADIPRIDLELQEALIYLKGDTFTVAGERGFQLMTFQQEPLGWIKHIGNRFNNLYPKDWRIRMRID